MSTPGSTGLLAALQAVQSEAPTLPKDKTNPHFQSRYTGLDTIVEKIGPLLHTHGLLWTALPGGSHDQPTLSYRLAHVESGEVIEGTMPLLLDKPTAQALGSALTYARRYSLCAVLNLVADEDDDGSAASSGQGSTTVGKGFASDAQQKLIKTLITKKGVSLEQLVIMLDDLGAEVEPTPGWTGRLSGGRDGAASGLISWLKEEDRKIPSAEHPSDVAEPAADEFVHPPADPSGTPLDEQGEPGPQTELVS